MWVWTSGEEGRGDNCASARCGTTATSVSAPWETVLEHQHRFVKAHQRLFYLLKPKQANLPQKLLVNFYHCAINSVLTYCVSVWFTSCTEAEQLELQRVKKIAGKNHGGPDITTVNTSHRIQSITRDHPHPAHHLFKLLPSGRRYRSVRVRTIWMTNSFFPPVKLWNKTHSP